VLAFGLAVALAGLVVAGVVATQRDQGNPAGSPPATTTPARPATPTTAKLPAPLDDAIRRLEQAVAK
jgi:hypothetical protein